MNNQKPRKLHELIGLIQKKDLRKSYEHKDSCPKEVKKGERCPQANCYYGEPYYRLQVFLENSPTERIYVYPSYLEKEQIYKDILESNYIDQRYLFYCLKGRKTGNYILTNWKELKLKGGQDE